MELVANKDFTFGSYNLGCLRDHYDYMIAARMSVLMRDRYRKEPLEMDLIEKVQQVAARKFLESDSVKKDLATREWDELGYQALIEKITVPPGNEGSIHQVWYDRSNAMMSDFRTFPIRIEDVRIKDAVIAQVGSLEPQAILFERQRLYQKIITEALGTDIVCFQEADYMPVSMLPNGYQSVQSNRNKSIQRIAWKASRFELIQNLGDIASDKGLAVLLRDKTTQKTVAVATAHLQGCNPFQRVYDQEGKSDSIKGDEQLSAVIQTIDRTGADVQIVGMDSNVTAMHPRLQMLRTAGFEFDGDHYIEPTCPSPYFICNTRLDWIAAKGASLVNMPVMNVDLNNLSTNPSDHKPIAARVHYAAADVLAQAS